MATITQIKVRNGNIADLPILEPGEFGYATDVQRLFIGNNTVTRSGDGVTTAFTFTNLDFDADDTNVVNSTLDFGTNLVYAIYIDDGNGDVIQQNPTDYTVSHSVITFTNPPALTDTIKLKYNTEVKTQSPNSDTNILVNGVALASAGSATNTGIAEEACW